MNTSVENRFANLIDGASLGMCFIHCVSNLDLKHAIAIGWHAHPMIEIICSLKDNLTYEFHHHRAVSLRPGQFLVIPAHTEHRLVDGIDKPGRRLGIFLDLSARNSRTVNILSAEERLHIRQSLLALRQQAITCTHPATIAAANLADLTTRTTQLSESESWESRAYVLEILAALSRAKTSPSVPKTLTVMRGVKDWMEKHFREKVSCDELVTLVGYGRARFFQLFKSQYGVTPGAWLTQRRIREAKALLKRGSSVMETAHKCGYPDPFFFSRTFKKQTGMSPSEFRSKP